MSGLIPKRELITASAGSGKTFQLTDRYIGLLLGGEDPESIVALTFSRKAAGEFFDAILDKLAQAAVDEKERASLNERLGIQADGATYRDKLGRLLSVMHKLTLGTLDSFYNKILSRFPMEHGLGGDFRILDESTFQLQLGRALETLFHRGRSDPRLGEDLETAFRAARTGSDDRAFAGWLVSLAEYYRSLRSLCPQEERWGNPDAIWTDGAPWLDEDGESFETDLGACRKMIEDNGVSDPSFTAAQQATWVDQFGRYLIRAYARRFDRDGGRHFEITGARDVDRGRRQVEVALVGDDGERTPIRYVLANRGGDWRIVDITGRFAETLGLDSDRRAAAVREHGAAAFLDRFERRLEAGPELPQA